MEIFGNNSNAEAEIALISVVLWDGLFNVLPASPVPETTSDYATIQV
jgi:hypothetical protein